MKWLIEWMNYWLVPVAFQIWFGFFCLCSVYSGTKREWRAAIIPTFQQFALSSGHLDVDLPCRSFWNEQKNKKRRKDFLLFQSALQIERKQIMYYGANGTRNRRIKKQPVFIQLYILMFQFLNIFSFLVKFVFKLFPLIFVTSMHFVYLQFSLNLMLN